MHHYSLGARGFFAFADRFAREGVGMPVVIVPSSKHYSWPKSTFVLGLGYDNELPKEGVPPRGGLINIPVDADARMPIEALREKLIECVNYKIPVIQVVAVIGSTEESAIDPLTDILSLRREFRLNNIDFNIHADAAWGGYLLSAIRKPFTITPPFPYPGAPYQKERGSSEDIPFDVEGTLLSDYTCENMMALRECDSLTIDPHKWGYIPYPAGSLTYRNIATTNLVTFGAPYIGSQGAASSLAMGESGIEGSKPGASAAAVFLSHRILRPDRSGYGQLIQGALFNARVFFIHLLRVVNDYNRGEIDFKPYLLRQNDVPRSFWNDSLIRKFMDRTISNDDFILEISSRKNLDLIRSLGPDQSTLAYAFNKRDNVSLKVANDLNDKTYSMLYPNPTEDNPVVPIDQFDMFITRTSFSGHEYGPVFVKSFADGLGVDLEDPGDAKITCLRSVVMDPWMVNTLDGAHDFIGSTLIPALMDAVKGGWLSGQGLKGPRRSAPLRPCCTLNRENKMILRKKFG